MYVRNPHGEMLYRYIYMILIQMFDFCVEASMTDDTVAQVEAIFEKLVEITREVSTKMTLGYRLDDYEEIHSRLMLVHGELGDLSSHILQGV